MSCGTLSSGREGSHFYFRSGWIANILATLFKFQQFVFEYGPLFLAAWLGLAVMTGLIAALQRKGIDLMVPSSRFLNYRPLGWIWRLVLSLLWCPGGKIPALATFSGLLLFSLTASITALVVTSIIGVKAVLLRVILTSLYAFSLRWFVTSVISRKPRNFREQRPAVEAVSPSWVLNGETPALPPSRLRFLAQVTWKSFASQVDRAVIPLIIGLVLASALTIYVPAYVIRPWLGDSAWLGPYLAVLLAMPFQLVGGTEVPLASALLVKGVSLGTALSIMLAAPSTSFSVILHLYRPVKVKTMALYLVTTWFVAGSLGIAVDSIQRLFSGW